jgi:aryl-phospho-beta-D-glucosidase BglC (GH1 family)
MERRSFIKHSAIAAAALTLNAPDTLASLHSPPKNKLPKWKGFNLLDFFSPNPVNARQQTTAEHLKWMRDWGFNFVRIPIAYPSYLNIDRSKNITPEDTYKIDQKAVDKIDSLIMLAQQHNMHVSINLHRAPGYCVNAGFNEPFNLWRDQSARMLSIFTGLCGPGAIKILHPKK